MAKRDYYEVLGVSRNATDKEIKHAYRKMAKKYHPDTNAGNKQAEQKFKEITEAYGILSDPEKKKMYDQFGFAAFEEGRGAGGASGGFGGFGGNGGYQSFHFDGNNMGDIFGDLFGDMFQRGGSRGNSGFRRGASPTQGQNVQADIRISFEDAAFGCDKVVNVNGQDGKKQSLKVHIPAGIDDGKSIRLKGRGNPGIHGGTAGDLLLKVHILPKAGYERKGLDVYTTVNIPFTTAVFGGDAIVPTIHGKVSCRIPAGTQSGSKIRLKQKGIVSMNQSSVHGDQYVIIQIQVPKHLSQEESEKLREFEQLFSGEIKNC